MQGYYIHYRDVLDENRTQTGIDRKVASQIAAFNRAGCDCEFLFCPQPETTPAMVASCLPLLSDGVRWPESANLTDADFLYIRRPRFASHELIGFLQGLREVNPDILVIYEIPTYPYDGEMETPKLALALAKDRRFRKQLPELVDYAAILTGESRALGMPTVHISNGLDLASVQPRKPSSGTDTIDIICVAFFEPWHGADRLLEGLKAYYQGQEGSRDIHLHLVGGGSQLPVLQKLSERLGLDEHVTFYGPLSPKDLDPLYDRCSLAVECLGVHRKGGDHPISASLKSREYLAKGMPFVYSGEIDLFQRDPVDFCLQVPADESPVDFRDVVAFRDRLSEGETEEELIARIRRYAEERISMDVAMGGAVDLIKTRCS